MSAPLPDGTPKLKRDSVRSGAVTVITQATSIGLHMVSTVVLARLLRPEDYGLVAMVLVLTGFAKRFQDLGLSLATVQRKGLTHEQLSAVFWLNVGVGALLTTLVAALGPVMAWFYSRPEMLWITVVSSVNFFIAGLAAQHTAFLKREMKFGSLALRQMIASIAGVSVAIGGAAAGLGFWALVFGELTTTICGTVGLWFVSDWRPGPPQRAAGVGGLLRFGANVTGFEVTNYFARNADNLLIGRVWGPDALGLYSKAYSLLMLPINTLRGPLNDVAFPALSQLQQDGRRYQQYFRRYLSSLAFVSMPLAAFLFVTSDSVIALCLGERWSGSAEIFRVLALTAFVQPTASTRGLVLMTTGNDKRYFRLGLWNAAVYVTAFSVGVPWGGLGVAYAYTIANYLMLIPSLAYCYSGTPVKVLDYFRSVARASVACLVASILTLLINERLIDSSAIVRVMVSLVTFGPCYVLVFAACPGGIKEMREYVSFRAFFRCGKSGAVQSVS